MKRQFLFPILIFLAANGVSQDKLVENADYFSGVPVWIGQKYELVAKGFERGDRLVLSSETSQGRSYRLKVRHKAGDTVFVKIPSQFQTGKYRLTLMRGRQRQFLGYDSLWVARQAPRVPRVGAHRGYCQVPGAVANSRASLRGAIALGVYGSEFDIWLTQDNHLVVNHDATLHGVSMEKSSWAEVRRLKLSNGESLPSFSEFVEIIKTSPYTKLFVEVKKHKDPKRSVEAAQMAMTMLEEAHLLDKAEFLSFSLEVCQSLCQRRPQAIVYYLGGDKSPRALHDLGITAFNYKMAAFRKHPRWIEEAHALGLVVTCRGLNKREHMVAMANQGVDNMATDDPVEALKVRHYYQQCAAHFQAKK